MSSKNLQKTQKNLNDFWRYVFTFGPNSAIIKLTIDAVINYNPQSKGESPWQ